MADALARAVVAAQPAGAALHQVAAEAVSDLAAASLAVAGDPAALADRDRLLDWALAQSVPAAPRAVIGAGADRALAPAQAALVGGFQAHLLDLDDTHEEVRGHPSAVLVPALLALAADDTPLEHVLAAYAVGLEVMARLGRALGPEHYAAGWHPTGTAGAVAAAAAGAHLLRLGEEATASALSIAASRAGGLRAQFGTPVKPLHAGLAAQTGVESVQWARAGLRAAEQAVTGEAGLLAAHGVGADVREEIAEGFGERWSALDPGIWVKRFPFCSAAMSMADAAAGLLAAQGDGTAPLDPASIREVVVRLRPGADAALVHTAPETGEQARFSAEAILALILLGRSPDLAELSPRPLDPEVRALAARVRREHVPGEPLPGGRRDFWAEVEVRPADGPPLTAQTLRPLGAPDRPLPVAARRAKLIAATGDAARADRIRALLGLDPAGDSPMPVGRTPDGATPDGATPAGAPPDAAVDDPAVGPVPRPTSVGALLAELVAAPTPLSTPTEGPTR